MNHHFFPACIAHGKTATEVTEPTENGAYGRFQSRLKTPAVFLRILQGYILSVISVSSVAGALSKLAVLCLLAQCTAAAGEGPVATDSRLVVELVAREPDILTPTGIAVDEGGRIWVVENNTHERPTAYKGPAERSRAHLQSL